MRARPKPELIRGSYKRKVLETLERAFHVGRMQIHDGPAKGAFRLIFHDAEFPEALADYQ